MCSPHRLEDSPLFGMLLDVSLEDRRESPNAGADVGIAVAGRDELERLFDPREEETLLAPRECRKERGACPQRERDLGGREQSRSSEELDRFTDPGDRAVGEDPGIPNDPMEPERRVDRHEDEALRLPRAVHRVHEFGVGLLGGESEREAARYQDLTDEGHRPEVRAAEDHALAKT